MINRINRRKIISFVLITFIYQILLIVYGFMLQLCFNCANVLVGQLLALILCMIEGVAFSSFNHLIGNKSRSKTEILSVDLMGTATLIIMFCVKMFCPEFK